MRKTVAISGYFNPLHVGHLRYIEAARDLGYALVVIVNNDKQVELKGSTPFMTQSERLEIMSALWGVHCVVLSIDNDRSVCKTLSRIKPDIFAVGADHPKNEKLKEEEVCKKLGIKIVHGVGGKKIQSSSTIINKVKKNEPHLSKRRRNKS